MRGTTRSVVPLIRPPGHLLPLVQEKDRAAFLAAKMPLHPKKRNPFDLRQSLGPLRFRRVAKPRLERLRDVARAQAAHRDDEREAEALAIGLVPRS